MSLTIPFPSNVLRARELFFQEGNVPSGLISDAVIRSWRRCADEGRTITEKVEYNTVSRLPVSQLLERNQQLLAAAEPAISQLASAVAGIGYGVLLTDACGAALAVCGSADGGGRLMRKALRPGIDLSEQAIGTNAMSTAIAERQAVSVIGAEHFFSQNQVFQCAAAPIFDPKGTVIGSIDISRDGVGPNWPALPLVLECAMSIETALFLQLPAYLTVSLNWTQNHLGITSPALLSFGPDGDIVAINPACRTLIGLSSNVAARHYNELFSGSFGELVTTLRRADTPVALRLQFGLSLYVQAIGHVAAKTFKKSLSQAKAADEAPRQHEFGDDLIPARLARAERALAADLPVLIAGETGTGKEVAALALHRGSRNRRGPFVAINCAAIPRELIEGELFGYADGAFTGARRGGAKGKIEQAHQGSLFLDEVGDMPLELQTRLLRVLETREVNRLGDSLPCKVEFQLICATHQNLELLIEDGRFREDLYYRINGFALELPPLRSRSRMADLLAKLGAEEGIPSHRLSGDTRDILLAYKWPGNVRELRHAFRHAKAMCDDDEEISPSHLPERIKRAGAALIETPDAEMEREEASLKDLASRAMEEALQNFDGNVTLAAQHLGVSRSTLHRWMKKKQ